MKFISRSGVSALAVGALIFAAACSPASDGEGTSTETSSLADCKPADLPLIESGKLTIATDDPAFDPWFSDNDPSNGKGFESAVAYAVADKLGFDQGDVAWVKAGFNQVIQAGKKNFDFDINQFSITEERKQAVDFSSPYYSASQAIITLKDSKYANATSLADFKSAKIGAQVATTSLKAIDQIAPTTDPLIYDDTTKAGQALSNGQVDAIMADLPTAFYLTAALIDDSKIVGQFQPATGETEAFGLLLGKGSGLTTCVSAAVDALREDGTLKKLEQEWLSDSAGAPELK